MTLDRYILQELAKPFGAVFLGVVALMSIEHLPSLLSLARNVGESRRLVASSMVALLPEYAAIALILALFFAVALTIRKLSLSSELDALRAAGYSDIRILKVPVVLGLIVGAILLVVRFEGQPLGERNLVALGDQVEAGDFGLNFDPRSSFQIAADAMLQVDAVSADHHSLSGILLVTGDRIIAAKRGTVALDRDGQVMLGLEQGRIIMRRGSVFRTRAGFASLELVLPKLGQRPAKVTESDRRASLTFGELRQVIANSNSASIRRAYEAVFYSRLSIGIIVMLLPLPAFVLGLPARRQPSGFGFAIGITMIVGIVRSTSPSAGANSTHPLLYGSCLTIAWVFIFVSLFVMNRKLGDGFADRIALRLSRAFRHWLTKRLGDAQET